MFSIRFYEGMRKGQLSEVTSPMLFIFLFAVFGVVAATIIVLVRDSGAFSSYTYAQNALNKGVQFYSGLDTGLVIGYIGLVLASLISAFLIDVHPIFVFIQVILFIVTFIYPAVLVEVYSNYTSASGLANGVAVFPKVGFLINNFIYAYIAHFVLWGLVLFSKFGGSNVNYGF